MLTLERLSGLAREHAGALSSTVRPIQVGGERFDFNAAPAIMGVINLSPDSWYRESVALSAAAAIERGAVLHAQGARIVDVGAESTLAHAARADAALQQSMLLPVIKGLRERRILVSVETYDVEVAEACLKAGANVLNLTGTRDTETMYRLAADHGAAVIVCYVEGEHVRAVTDFDLTADPIPRMCEYFAQQIEIASDAGLSNALIDPGMGFYYRNLQDSSMRVRHQANIFLNTFRLRKLGVPICHALPHAFEFFREEVRVAEPFFAVLAALGKTDLFRTHEVPRTRAVLETLRVI
jgi:dihydropteroate synthase